MSAADLAGRLALVTGGSAGIGLAAAQALAERGARIALSSRGGEKLDRAAAELAAAGAEVEAFAADVARADDLERLVAEVGERLGPVDVLVANGGGPAKKAAAELDDEDWQSAIPLVLLFVPRLCRLVLPGMRRRGWGRIVAVNSVSTRQPIPGLALSNALRPAVWGYLKTLSAEVAADGVTVNAVLPGFTLTGRQQELFRDVAARQGKSLDEVIAAQAAAAPSGRMAEPSEIGEVIGFVCSPAASYLTGQAVTVDGGYVRSLL